MGKKIVLIGLFALLWCFLANAQDSTLHHQKSFLDDLCNPKLSEAVRHWVGTPYKMGGTSEKGTDCSGLVRSIFRTAYGIELSRTSRSMFQEVERIAKKQELEEGDILFFKRGRRISHVGIYLRDNWYIHASTREGVVIRQLDKKSRRLVFFCAGRIKNLPEMFVESLNPLIQNIEN